MTIQEWFEGEKIFQQDVTNMADESEYASSAAKFITEKWNADVDDLSVKQTDWAGRILDDMVERRIEGRR